MSKQNYDWDIVVRPKSNLFTLNFQEVWTYRDLVFLMVRRDITAIYKQTILGPLWMFIQPIFTTLIYTFTFGQANISTGGIPPILFYLIGQTFWMYFAECLNKTSTTFIANAAVFGKVYFPRLVMPFSIIISNLLRLGIQLILLIIVYIYYKNSGEDISLQLPSLVLLPLLIIMLGLFSLSLGILFSSLTTKYRDFTFLLSFAVQLLMFLSCVVFPISMFHGTIKSVMILNPIAIIMEAIKFVTTGHGFFDMNYILVSLVTIILLFLVSIVVFNKTEKSFMDTV